MNKTPLLKVINFIFILLFLFSSFGYIRSLLSTRHSRDQFFIENQITRINLNIETPSSIKISADLYYPSGIAKDRIGYLPTILIIPGANAQKDQHMRMHLQFVLQGYAVLAMEQRGHGVSGGSASFYREEPRDVIAVMDYLTEHYPFLNSTHFGLIGLSYGGGTALWVQALDSRVYATVVYHPLANLTMFLETTPVHYLIGFKPEFPPDPPFKLGQIMDWDSYLHTLWAKQSAINYVNPQNTENLLIMHGDQDDTIPLQSSLYLYQKLTSDENNLRNDIQFVIRPGLGHGGNERDSRSLQYSLTWFDHYFVHYSSSIDSIETKEDLCSLFHFDYPVVQDYSIWVYLIIIGSFGYLWIQNFPFNFNFLQKNSPKKEPESSTISINSSKVLFLRSIILVGGFGVALLINLYLNPALVWTWLVFPGVFQLIGYFLLPFSPNLDGTKKISHVQQILQEWQSNWTSERIRSYMRGWLLCMGTLLGGPLLIALAGYVTYSEVLPIVSTSTFGFLILIALPLFSGLAFLRNLSPKSWGMFWFLSSIAYGILISIRVVILSPFIPSISPYFLGWLAGFVLSTLILILIGICRILGKLLLHNTIAVWIFGFILALLLIPGLRFY